MQKISINEILALPEYEKVRPDFQRKIVEFKEHRRLSVGPNITLVFENRDTVRFQIQEMIRIEKIIDQKIIRREIDSCNALIPDDNELSATMLIEVEREELFKPVLDSLVGLEKDSVFLRIGRYLIPAYFDEGQVSDFHISTVQHIKFPFTPQQIHGFRNFNEQATIVINHKNYKYDAEIPIEIRNSLIEDFGVE